MTLIIGKFELEIHFFELFLRVPYIGEMYWHPQMGLTADTWSSLFIPKPSTPL